MKRFLKAMALTLAAGGLAAAAAKPWRIPRATAEAALSGSFAGASGLRAVVGGAVTLKMLPRPRLQATQLAVSAEDGAVALDAPLLKADLDIPSLLRGRWRTSSATLVEPTLTVDLDRLAARAPSRDGAGSGTPAMLRFRSGLLKTRSETGFADLLATGIDATATWGGEGEGLVVSGAATLRGTRAQFAGALQHPALSFTAAGSPASLQIASSLFDFSADGVLSGGTQEQFAGRASLATASLPRLTRVLDGFPVSLGSKRASVSGDLVARPRDLSLSNVQLRLDKTRFEGTLAWRHDGARGLVDGTLATELLDLDALAGDGLDGARLARLYGRPLDAWPFGIDVDLRVSATAARLGRATLEDAAFAALVRGDRLEVTLDEAQAYGGLIKARAVATLGPAGIDAHADLSAKHVDLALLSEGLSGHDRVGGTMTAHAALDGRGASFRDVVADLKGEGQIGVDGGRLAGLSLAQALRRLSRRLPLDADRRATPTTFDGALWDVSIRDGVVRVPNGRLTAPGVVLSFGAETGLPDGRVDLHAVAAQTDGAGAPLSDGAAMPLDVRGFLAGPLTLVGHGAGLPAVRLPIIDGIAAGR